MAPKRKKASGTGTTKKKKKEKEASSSNDNTSVASSEAGQDTPTLTVPPVVGDGVASMNGEKPSEESGSVLDVMKKAVKEEDANLEENVTKKRKLSPPENIEIPKRKFEMSLKKPDPSSSKKPSLRLSPPTIATKSTEKICSKPSCYLCQIQKQRSGSPEPLPSIDPVEISIDNYIDSFCEHHKSSITTLMTEKASTPKTLPDIVLASVISCKETDECTLNEEEIFKFEKKIDVISGITPSIIIRLYTTYFTLESPKINELPASSPTTRVVKYNEATKLFLSKIATCKLSMDLVEEFRDLNCTFYDGCIIVQVTDMRANDPLKKTLHPTQTLILKPYSSNLEKQICEFVDDNLGDNEKITLSQRMEIMQQIINSVKHEPSDITTHLPSLCLDPNPKVSLVANSIQYNSTKQFFRRRTRPKHHYFNYSQKSQASGVEAVSIQSTQKQDHNLLNFIASSKIWNESLISRKDKATILHLPNNANKKKKQKLSSKQKKSKENETFPRNQQSEATPTEYVKLHESQLVNNKPPNRCRILKFESYDKQKVWRVDIIPLIDNNAENSKKFEAFIIPPHNTTNTNQPVFQSEQPSSCVIGGRHATELYARRLKDMFTSSGKTKLVLDHEVDLQSYINNTSFPKPALFLQRLNKLSHPPLQNIKAQPNAAQNPAGQPATGGAAVSASQAQPNANTVVQSTAAGQIQAQATGLQTGSIPKQIVMGGNTITGVRVNPTTGTAQIGSNVIQNIPFNVAYPASSIPINQLQLLNSVISSQPRTYSQGGINYLIPTGTINPGMFINRTTGIPANIALNPANGQPNQAPNNNNNTSK